MVPASAYALTAGSTNALAGPASIRPAPKFSLAPHRIAYGRTVTATGRAPRQDAGERLAFQFSHRGDHWRTLATTRIGNRGGFRFHTELRRSGFVRITGSEVVDIPHRTAGTLVNTPTGISPSAWKTVHVAAELAVSARLHNVLGGGQAMHVHGHVVPGFAGRTVRLVNRTGRTLATARTGRWGGFDLRFVPGTLGRRSLWVRFAGDRVNAQAATRAGTVSVFTPSVASWYNDGGSTACGFHAFYGVANKALPCGTKVTFEHSGRTVTATVDDRGPFVAGREWDLNQNTAGALGVGSVAMVWSSM
jgi:hypothetical protein